MKRKVYLDLLDDDDQEFDLTRRNSKSYYLNQFSISFSLDQYESDELDSGNIY